MKKIYAFIFVSSLLLVSCGGNHPVKPSPKPAPPVASKPAPSPAPAPAATPSASAPAASSPDAMIGDNSKKPGGYYLDDGPDANPPKNIDSIPDAMPKQEPLLPRSNKPYKALGQTYTPLSSAQDYKERGMASWYGKRFHGKKTSSGEIYDMYSMSAAHTRLPLPSYVKVTNLGNGRSVIVRVNDRGPFKSTRIIDLSYAAAYKLRLVNQGSGMVEVEAIHPDKANNSKAANNNAAPPVQYPTQSPAQSPAPAPEVATAPAEPANTMTQALPEPPTAQPTPATQTATEANTPNANPPPDESASAIPRYFIQVGAFKNEVNAEALKAKIQGLEFDENVGIERVYNNGLHRLFLGPYDSKQAAEPVAADIRKRLNLSTIITNQSNNH